MVVNSSITSLPGNPFSGATQSQSSSAATSSFEQQLSSALAESLGKLGVAPGEVNITIRNGGTAGVESGLRQIVVSYRVEPNQTSTNQPVSESSSITTEPTQTVVKSSEETRIHDWAPYNGPKDSRDEVPSGSGLTTSSGAPLIAANANPSANQYGYSGPAARNPYFTTPSNPLRPGFVLGFHNWFQESFVLGGITGAMPANKVFNSTEEGAQEALRLVSQYYPDATVTNQVWGSGGGPFMSSKPTYSIELPDGRRVNAGALLNSYYNQGYGVTAASDDMLRRGLDLA